MKTKAMLFCMFIIFILISGCGKSEPKEYVSKEGGYKFTGPAGWHLDDEGDNTLVIKRGNNKLIETLSMQLEDSPEQLGSLSEEELFEKIKSHTIDIADAYCSDAGIENKSVNSAYKTQLSGLPAYRIQAEGYANGLGATAVVDIIVGYDISKANVYLFASQIEKSEYADVMTDLDAVISSYQVIQ